MDRAWKGLLKSGIIFLSFSLFVYIFYYIDFLEENTLLDSIAWPNIPSVPPPVSLNDTSNAALSNSVILPRPGGGSWLVGDQVEVMIKMFDFKGRPKTHGGDFLLARLHNQTLEAGVAGQVVDHLNGTYSAVFLLPWEGKSQVEVISSVWSNKCDVSFTFMTAHITFTTICSGCLPPTQQPQCNYTDLNTGELWFCYKPQNLSCDARINHFVTNHKPVKCHLLIGQLSAKTNKDIPGPAGYYYKGLWSSLSGSTVKRLNSASAISQCLKDKVVHMYGDSTVRQKGHIFNLILRYIANELDGVTGGKNTVVVIGFWAHLTIFPIKYYIRRIMSIRKAVVRLLARAPDTRVIIRTANLKQSPAPHTMIFSDWPSLQRDKILRSMFQGMKVYFVDAWEMTVAHYLKHDIHPPRPIIKNMIDVVLSYICPPK
uniref:Neurexophilin and PC-esterase domain family, member 3 n=1 Tax=Salarias fasciatus TaxID=181472 RepID=A0A672HEY5_SALFA